MTFFEGTPAAGNTTNASTAAAGGVEYLMNRIGATGMAYPRFRHEATEQANKDLIDVFSRDIKEFLDNYLMESKLIEMDPRLSPAGILEKIKPLQQKYNADFNNGLVARCRRLQEAHMKKVELVFTLPPEVTTVEPVLLHLQSREIRDYVLSLSYQQRINLLLSNDDPALLHAVFTAPSCLEIIPAAVLKAAQILRVRRKRSAELQPLEDERLALERINGFLNNVPRVMDFVSIVPNLWPLPDSVFPAEELDPILDAEIDADLKAEIIRLNAEMAAEFSAE